MPSMSASVPRSPSPLKSAEPQVGRTVSWAGLLGTWAKQPLTTTSLPLSPGWRVDGERRC